MNIDAELTDPQLELWRQQWQSETTVPLDLRRQVARQSRLMKIGLILDTLVTLVMGGGTTAWAMRSSQPDIVLIPVATWLFLAAAWTFVLTANRGNWAPSGLDTAAFLNLSIRRCRTALSTIWFAVALFVCEIAFGLAWAYTHTTPPRPSLLTWLWFSSLRIDIVWMCSLAFLAGILWYRKKKQAELASLLDLLAEMSPTESI
jgi:hypothetical protein